MKEQLQEISQKSQAETIDLWPEIYAELEETKTMKAPRLSHQLARIAAVFSLFFLGGLVVYAISQIYVDTGLEGERAERLVTQVNQSITHGDITIRLDWAYADVNRVSVGYTLLDVEGNVFVPRQSEYIYDFGLFLRPLTEAEVRGYRPTISLINGTTAYDLSNEQQISTWIPFFYYELELPEYQVLEGETVELDMRFQLRGIAEMYRFLVEIPVYPAQFEVSDTFINDTDLPLVLSDLTITPSITSVAFCYTIPEAYRLDDGHWLTNWTHWESTVSLYFDDVEVSALYPRVGREFSTRLFEEGKYCSILNWAIPTDVLPERLRFVVHELRKSINGEYNAEQAEFLIEAYESRNIAVDSYLYAGSYSVWPRDLYDGESLTNLRIYDEIMSAFYDAFPEIPRIQGDWVIEFETQEALN